MLTAPAPPAAPAAVDAPANPGRAGEVTSAGQALALFLKPHRDFLFSGLDRVFFDGKAAEAHRAVSGHRLYQAFVRRARRPPTGDSAAPAIPVTAAPAAPLLSTSSVLADLAGTTALPGHDAEIPDARWANLVFLRRLAVYLKPYLPQFILGEVAGLGFAVFNGIIPLVLKVVFDHASKTGGAHPAKIVPGKENLLGGGLAHFFNVLAEGKYGIIAVCAAIPTVMIIRCLFDYINNYLVAWVSLRVLSDIRRQVFEHINRQSLQFFLQNRSGNLISRVSNDTRIIQTALGFLGTDLIEQPATALIAVSTLLYLDAKFTLMALVLFPLCIVPVVVYGKRIRKSGRQEEEQSGAMISILQETFAGIRVIKSFAREDYQVEQFDAANMGQFHTAIRVRKYTEVVGPMVEIVAALGVGLALVYVHYAGMELTRFVALTSGLFLLYQPIKQISRMNVQIQKCRAASDHIFKLLELQPTVRDAADAIDLTHCRGEVDFRHLYFQYDNAPAPALDNFNFHIRPGQSVALVGTSGAGKSTVLSLLQRFYEPAAGQIYIDGSDIGKLTQRSLRENIGVVTQDTFLFHDSIFENIRYGRLDASAAEIEEAAKQAYIHDFIMTLPEGYQTRIGDKGCRLSGGQQQRVAIARALLKDAPILLLDEATSALDSESERVIQVALETLSKGKTVIAIAHRLSTILNADTIIVMDAGRIVEQGRHAELYAHGGRYRRLYDLQFDHQNEAAEAEEEVEATIRPMVIPA